MNSRRNLHSKGVTRIVEIFPTSNVMLIAASRNGLAVVKRSRQQIRFTSGIKLLNEKAKAEEDYYFSKQDGTFSPNE